MTEDIVAAANVYWGNFIQITEDCQISHETPESIYLAKEMISNLSKESRDVLMMIANGPDELFLSNGRVCWEELKKTLRRHRWSWKRIDSAKREVQEICRSF